MQKIQVFIVSFLFLCGLHVYSQNSSEEKVPVVQFTSKLERLPAKRSFDVVYTNKKADNVYAEYSFSEFDKDRTYPALDVGGPKNEKGEWRIHIFPLSYGTRLYLRLTVVTPIEGEEMDSFKRLVSQAISTVIFDLFIPRGATGDESFMRKSPIFREAIFPLKEYRWKVQEEILTAEDYFPKVILNNFPDIFDGLKGTEEELETAKEIFKAKLRPILDNPLLPDDFKKTAGENKAFLKEVLNLTSEEKIEEEAWKRIKSAIKKSMDDLEALDIASLINNHSELIQRLNAIKADQKGAFEGLKGILDKKIKWGEYGDLTKANGCLEKAIENLKIAEKAFKTIYDKLYNAKILSMTLDSSEGEIPDIKSYFGIDTSIIGIPRKGDAKNDEIKAFLNFAIYLKKQPEDLEFVAWENGFCNWLFSRLTPMFGLGTSLLGDSSLPDQVFFAGLGVRLNKYFRLTAGKVFFKEKIVVKGEEKQELQTPWALGVSFDARAFALLVNKKD